MVSEPESETNEDDDEHFEPEATNQPIMQKIMKISTAVFWLLIFISICAFFGIDYAEDVTRFLGYRCYKQKKSQKQSPEKVPETLTGILPKETEGTILKCVAGTVNEKKYCLCGLLKYCKKGQMCAIIKGKLKAGTLTCGPTKSCGEWFGPKQTTSKCEFGEKPSRTLCQQPKGCYEEQCCYEENEAKVDEKEEIYFATKTCGGWFAEKKENSQCDAEYQEKPSDLSCKDCDKEQCCYKSCSAGLAVIDVPNSDSDCAKHAATCVVTCKAGYGAPRSETFYCDDGDWSGELDCSQIDNDNGLTNKI